MNGRKASFIEIHSGVTGLEGSPYEACPSKSDGFLVKQISVKMQLEIEIQLGNRK